MADPQHVEALSDFDRLTVRLYRVGLVSSAVGVVAWAVHFGLVAADRPSHVSWVWGVVFAGTWLSVWNVHLYDPRIRSIIAGFGAASAALVAVSTVGSLPWIGGVGFSFAALSAFALKEQYCFRLPGMRLVPLVLAVSLMPMMADRPAITAALLATAGVMLTLLAVAKLRMPLTHDIGDKSRYGV